MTKLKSKLNSVLIIIVFSIFFYSSVFYTIKVAEAATIKLNKSTVTINVGETYQLKLSEAKLKVTWTSSKKSVATVSINGLVTGKKVGSIIITAKANGIEYECTVNVVEPFIYAKKFENGIGGKTQYLVYNLPKKFISTDVIWKSSNESIFTVDKNGLVTATGLGKTKLTATFGTYKLTKTIYVNATKQNLQDAVNGFKIEYTEVNDEIVCNIINNSKIDISADCHLEFFDSTDTLVSVSTNGHMFSFRNEEYVFAFPIPDKEYEYYKIKFEKVYEYNHQINQKDKVAVSLSDKYDYTYNYTEIINSSYYTISDTAKVFDININNQSGKRVHFELYLLYYKDNKLVGYQWIPNYFDLDIGVMVIKNPQSLYRGKIPEYDSCRVVYSAVTNKN